SFSNLTFTIWEFAQMYWIRCLYRCSIVGMLLAVIRKRRFLDGRRQGRNGLVQFEAKVFEVVLGRRVGAEFVDDGSEIGQRADRGKPRCICRTNQAAKRPEEQSGLYNA